MKYFLLLPMLLLAINPLFSQTTTWTGSVSTAWNDSANWTGGVPDANDAATINNMANDPVITTAAFARQVIIVSGASLVISATGSLAISGAMSRGLDISGTVENNGTLTVNDTGFDGILLRAGSAFTNRGILRVGNTGSIGYSGISNSGGTFVNESGTISVDRTGTTVTAVAAINNALSFTNQATISIGGIAANGGHGLWTHGNAASFTNAVGASINIDQTASSGLYNSTNSSFTNQSTITIGATGSIGTHGLLNDAPFNNTGQINIDRVSLSGIRLQDGTFTNAGTVTIGALVPIGTIISALSGFLINNTGGTIKGTGILAADYITHAGGTLAPGYSPGKMTFDANANFSNSTMAMEVNGTGVAGVNYDQIAVTGTGTIGGTLALSINYVPVSGDQVTIFTATTARNGTFSSVTGLPSGWIVNYTSTAVILSFGPLPVELTDFTAKLLEGSVKLDWHTASENNNKGFYVERSNDARQWETLGFVAGKGTTTEVENYSFLDKKPLSAVNYYRLRQIDFDGKEELSKVVSVEMQNIGTVRVFPNPVSTGELTLLLPENVEEKLTVQLFNPMGQLLRTISINSGTNSLDVSDLETGIYYLEIMDKPELKAMKIIVDNP